MEEPIRSAPAPSGWATRARRSPAHALAWKLRRQIRAAAAPALLPHPNTKRTPNPLPSISSFGSWHHSSLPKRKKFRFSLGPEPRLGAYLTGDNPKKLGDGPRDWPGL